jgi:CheY-like chemotaxis protein
VPGSNRGVDHIRPDKRAKRVRQSKEGYNGMARILLVEDEMLVRELAFEDLTDAGHHVVAASSGDEGLAILQGDGNFDVLFTDIRLPGVVDGWELASEAKKLVPGLKVIYATGLNDDTGKVGADEKMLAKPYRKDDLLNAIA